MFRSAISAFFKTLCVIVGIGAGALIVSVGMSFMPMSIEPHMQTTTIAYRNALGETTLTGPVIARINIHGVIGMGDLRTEKVQALLDATQEGMYKGRTKALFLHINSPGGAAVDSENIYHALMAYKEKYKVPIYAYADGLCASGGMMISCAADTVLASPPSLIGSVGVVLSPFFNFTGLMEKVGVASETVTAGKNKRPFNPFRPWKANEGEDLKKITEGMYLSFITLVSKERPKLTVDKLRHEYGANIFMTEGAIERGYIHGSAKTLTAALNHFIEIGNLPKESAIIGPAIRHSLLEAFGSKPGSMSIQHEIKGVDTLPAEMQNRLCYLYLPGAQ